MDRTEPVERAATDDEAAHQASPNQQIRIQPGHALGNDKVALLLADQLMHNRNDVAGNREATERNMRAVGNGRDDLAHGFDFASHDRSLTLSAAHSRPPHRLALRSKEAIRQDARDKARFAPEFPVRIGT